MGELVRVAHDAHGLDPAVDDVHREDAPDVDGRLRVGTRLDRPAAGVAAAPHELGGLGGLHVAGAQARQRPLGRAPLGPPERPLGRSSQHAARLAVDPHPARLELARSGRPLRHGDHEARDERGADERLARRHRLAAAVAVEARVLGEQLLERLQVALLGGGEEPVEQGVAGGLVGVEARAAGLEALARARDELARVDLGPLDDLGDLRVLVAEHLAQQVGRALDRVQLLQEHEQGERQRVRELGARGRAGGRVLQQRLRQPRPHVCLAAGARRPQDVDREPRRHRRDPGGRLVDRAFLAGQPQKRLLRHVLGLGDAAEHPVGHAEAVPPQALELVVGHRDGHGNSDVSAHRVVTGGRSATGLRRQRVAKDRGALRRVDRLEDMIAATTTAADGRCRAPRRAASRQPVRKGHRMPSHSPTGTSRRGRASSPVTRRALMAVIAGVVALAVLAPVASAKDAPLTIPLPAGSSPEDVTLGKGTTFYTGSLTGQGIFAGDLRTGQGHHLVQRPGHPITGLYVDDRNRIWAAGGPAADLRVYDAGTCAQLASYSLTGAPGFVSDIVVTDDAAYVTDSFQPRMYTIPLGKGGSLPGQSAVRTTALTGDFVQTGPTGTFNANGIAFFHDRLVIGQTVTGKLFSVDPATGVAKAIDLGGQTVVGADGLMLRNNTLYIAQNFPNLIAVVRLDSDVKTGQVEQRVSDPRFDIPSSVIVFGDAVYAMNARFSTPVTPDKPYDLVGVSLGHGGD